MFGIVKTIKHGQIEILTVHGTTVNLPYTTKTANLAPLTRVRLDYYMGKLLCVNTCV